ncbi:hypothetical protein SADUNF_Sadunf09G0119600 [Salix dunnii]|uniref:Uncharacterized protein n=1 Tax=Salix dunnii TaxID=1413687 RepID=A0A835JW76_9ROSI|nr:hypothetical protein SADUNF_Sadunf09G0119600 [Salix dunnii]
MENKIQQAKVFRVCKHVNKKSGSQCSKESTPKSIALFRGIKENSLILLRAAIKGVKSVLTGTNDDRHTIVYARRTGKLPELNKMAVLTFNFHSILNHTLMHNHQEKFKQ